MEFTPPTKDIKIAFAQYGHLVSGKSEKTPAKGRAEEFASWLEAHDREVAAKTLREYAGTLNLHVVVPDGYEDLDYLCQDDECLWWDMTYAEQDRIRDKADKIVSGEVAVAVVDPVVSPRRREGTPPPCCTATTEVEGHWLVERHDHHTCGVGFGYYGLHEPGCGTVPLVDLRGLPGWNSLVTVVLNDPPTTTTEYGTRDVHAPDAPVFNTDMSLDQIKYYYRTRAADCQDYEIVQREVTQHYGPWTVYDPVEPYDESKR